jgi:AcrR family transcriptional regulator
LSTKQKILIAAAREFSENGFQTATMRKISSRAGINHAGINYHFKSKIDLYREVVSFLFENSPRFSQAEIEINSAEDWRRALNEWALNCLKNMGSTNEYSKWKNSIMFREMVEPSGLLEYFFDNYMQPDFEVLKEYVKLALGANCSEKDLCFYALMFLAQCVFYEQNRLFVTLVADEYFFEEDNLRRIADNIVVSFSSVLDYRLRKENYGEVNGY